MTLSGHSKAILVLCKAGVDEIWSGCEDGSIGVWSSQTLSFKKQLDFHKGPVVSLVAMGGNVWSGSGDHTVLVWDASICQLLFTLGDHGGYVKAMVRVEYMCWVFASGKNVKVWCAQSVWKTCEQEKDRLNSEILKLKYDLGKSQWEKKSLGDVSKKKTESSAEKLSDMEREVEKAQKEGAALLARQIDESELLKDEHARKVQELERLVNLADESKRILADENKLLLGEIAVLKAEKERVEIESRKKLQNLEKDVMQAQDQLRKSRDKLEDLTKANKSNESSKIITLSELKKAQDEKQMLVNEVAQLNELARREKDSRDHAAETVKASHEQLLVGMTKKLQEMQSEVEQSRRKSSSHLQKKTEEFQKLESELKKTAKDLNKALKSLEDEKTRAAKDVQELRRTIEHMKKNQNAISASEAKNMMKFENLERDLQQTRNELQIALDEKSRLVSNKDNEMQKLRLRIRDLKKALKDAENETHKLQQSSQEREKDVAAINNKDNQLQHPRDDPSQAFKDRASDSDNMNEFLGTANTESDETGKRVKELQTQLKNLEEELAHARAVAGEHTLALQNLGAEKDSLCTELKNATAALQNLGAEKDSLCAELKNATAAKIQLEEDLNCVRAASCRAASDQALAAADLKKLQEDNVEKLDVFTMEKELTTTNMIKLTDAIDNLKKEKSALEDEVVLANNKQEKLRSDIANHEERATRTSKESEQLDQRLAQAVNELDQLRKEKANEINRLKMSNDVQEKRLEAALAAAQPQQLPRHDERIVSSAEEVSQLRRKLAELEEGLAYATQEIELLNREKFLQNCNTAPVDAEASMHKKGKSTTRRRLVHEVEELARMKRRMSTPDEDFDSSDDELDQLRMDRHLSDLNYAHAASELRHLKKENEMLKCRLANTAEKLEHLLEENASLQLNSDLVRDELDQLQQIKSFLEGVLARETNGLEQLGRGKSLVEVNVSQVADGHEKRSSDEEFHKVRAEHMLDVNNDLRNELVMLEDGLEAFQMQHADMQEKIGRLQSLLEEAQDECRVTKEIACSDAEDAARRIAELQERVAELEENLQERLAELEENNSPLAQSIEGAVWERVRELEMALLQAHIDYNSLCREFKKLRKRRKSTAANATAPGGRNKTRKTMQTQTHNFSKSTVKRMRGPPLGDTVEVAMKSLQPGFSMEYTNLKVSGCNGPKTTNVEVCPEKQVPLTIHVVTPVVTPRRMTPIRAPSPAPERIDPVEAPPPVIEEPERYFPSHGALRVRRSLGPAKQNGELNM